MSAKRTERHGSSRSVGSAASVQHALSRAVALHQSGDVVQARALYGKILRKQPRNFDALHLCGLAAAQLHDPTHAVELIGKAIALKSDYAPAHHHLGNAQAMLGRFEAAVASYDAAIAIRPDDALVHNNRGNALADLGRWEEAVQSYDRGIEIASSYAEAHYNRGCALAELRRTRAALASFDRAIALRPDYARAWNNRGIALDALAMPEAALQSFEQAVAIEPRFVDAINNRAYALVALKRYREAIENFDRVLELRSDYPLAHGARLRTRLQICDWRTIDADIADLRERIARGEPAARPFDVQAVIGSPKLQAQAAATWASVKYPPRDLLPTPWPYPRHERIRVGYFSSDFRNHAVSILAAELFEKHDRSRFEWYGFSFGPGDQDELRMRVAAAFDHFVDVREIDDRAVTELARRLEIDIAVDLGGFTQHSRTGIFAMRAAPVQASYLGYVGTMGADYIDYLIADDVVAPAATAADFAEKLVRLPSYQVNDSQRRIAEHSFTRAELGLPGDGFVYCSFNDNYKLVPETFDSWMRILQRAGGSVLFLYVDNTAAGENLRREAELRGIRADRIVFGNRLPAPEYRARYRACDLFLDTLPYNAGTTASDALWAGLPVLTCAGESFAGRVAASLLTAIELPELVTRSRQEYETVAAELATDPGRLSGIRRRLASNRATSALFDTSRFARHLEAAYGAIYERNRAGLPPDHISVPAVAGERFASAPA